MKALVLLSGGIDSSTCLAKAVERYGMAEVLALTTYYGQRHKKEIESARQIAKHYGVKHKELDLSVIFEGLKNPLMEKSDKEVPDGRYAEQLKNADGNPVSTYIPFRNGLFLSVAAVIGMLNGCKKLYYGAHADDAAGNAYPDCSTNFNKAINDAVYIGSGEKISIEAPFINMNKSEVVKEGLELGVPYELTWSCYKGEDEPCGKCGTCIDREEAFKKNGTIDPLLR